MLKKILYSSIIAFSINVDGVFEEKNLTENVCGCLLNSSIDGSLKYFRKIYNNHINQIAQIYYGPIHDAEFISFDDHKGAAKYIIKFLEFLLNDIRQNRICNRCKKRTYSSEEVTIFVSIIENDKKKLTDFMNGKIKTAPILS